MQLVWFLYFRLQKEGFRFICTAVALLFHITPSIFEEFIVSWDGLSIRRRRRSFSGVMSEREATVHTSRSSLYFLPLRFASELQTEDSSTATNSPDTVTVVVGS